MLSPNFPDFDALWDYAHPDRTETKFCEFLLHISEDSPVFLELLTQIARAQGLQGKYVHAHQTLDQVKRRLTQDPSCPKVRYLLERGRVFNSSGKADVARPFFEQAFNLARELRDDFYAVDALHMLAIVAPPEQSLILNRQAISLAESSQQQRARDWLGSLYNNIGWTYHDLDDHASALEMFEKAESWQRAKGRVNETRIAAWCVAHTLRLLGRAEEALSRQLALQEEFESAGKADGFVAEEIGECLLVLNRLEEAQPYFLRAYELLSRDPSPLENEPERLARLKDLGKESTFKQKLPSI